MYAPAKPFTQDMSMVFRKHLIYKAFNFTCSKYGSSFSHVLLLDGISMCHFCFNSPFFIFLRVFFLYFCFIQTYLKSKVNQISSNYYFKQCCYVVILRKTRLGVLSRIHTHINPTKFCVHVPKQEPVITLWR